MSHELNKETINVLKEFYLQQKEKKKSWINENSHWATKELSKPFDEADVVKFEAENNLRLPEDFRLYIINCSKEIFMSYYPTVIDFSYTVKSLMTTTCSISDDISCVGYDDFPGIETFRPCALDIGNDGCAFFICMVIKGNRLGTIWEHTDPQYFLAANSFLHLVEHHMELYSQGEMFGGNINRYPLSQHSHDKVYTPEVLAKIDKDVEEMMRSREPLVIFDTI